ncbi:MAG: hypothetical protein ABW116_09210 [Candidatus Sedimenticola sp. 20ELBAFRAG]
MQTYEKSIHKAALAVPEWLKTIDSTAFKSKIDRIFTWGTMGNRVIEKSFTHPLVMRIWWVPNTTPT